MDAYYLIYFRTKTAGKMDTKFSPPLKNNFLGSGARPREHPLAGQRPPLVFPFSRGPFEPVLSLLYYSGSPYFQLVYSRARRSPAERQRAREGGSFSGTKKDRFPSHAETTHKDICRVMPLSGFHLADPFAQALLLSACPRSHNLWARVPGTV